MFLRHILPPSPPNLTSQAVVSRVFHWVPCSLLSRQSSSHPPPQPLVQPSFCLVQPAPTSQLTCIWLTHCPDDGGSEHLWHICHFIQDYMAHHPRRHSSLPRLKYGLYEIRSTINSGRVCVRSPN